MAVGTQTTYDIDVADVEYLRHGDKPLLATVFKPRGSGPFPIMVELHGGSLRIRSEETVGTVVLVRLPAPTPEQWVGTGRELFGAFRAAVGPADAGAAVFAPSPTPVPATAGKAAS